MVDASDEVVTLVEFITCDLYCLRAFPCVGRFSAQKGYRSKVKGGSEGPGVDTAVHATENREFCGRWMGPSYSRSNIENVEMMSRKRLKKKQEYARQQVYSGVGGRQ